MLFKKRNRLLWGGHEGPDRTVGLRGVVTAQGRPQLRQVFSPESTRRADCIADNVPEEDLRVAAAGSQRATILSEGQRPDAAVMAVEAADFLTGGGFPQAHQTIA